MRAFTSVCALAAVASASDLAVGDYNYEDGGDLWWEDSPSCQGGNQSPIDINCATESCDEDVFELSIKPE